MAASNYVTGELLDRFNYSPRIVTAAIGVLFLLPGVLWFATARWWDRERKPPQTPAGEPTVASDAALREAAAKIHLSSD
jgi:hypothetical protein